MIFLRWFIVVVALMFAALVGIYVNDQIKEHTNAEGYIPYRKRRMKSKGKYCCDCKWCIDNVCDTPKTRADRLNHATGEINSYESIDNIYGTRMCKWTKGENKHGE
jgi:hypothetical protein